MNIGDMKKSSYDVGKQNESGSWEIMHTCGFVRPTPPQRKNLVDAFASVGMELKAKGFDLIRESDVGSINDAEKLAEVLDSIKIYELKTAGRDRKATIKENWSGLGFTLTGAEKHNAETLGNNYRFLFLNLKNNSLRECGLEDFFSPEISGIYPTWSVFIRKGLTD